MSYNSSRGGSFLGSIPDITKNLLIINVLMWIATMALQTRGVHLDKWFALHFWQAGDFMPWQIVTYMFMHDFSSVQGGLLHLFCNMFNLYMFGALLERMLGAKRYLVYYLVCGVGAGIVQELVWQLTWVGDVASALGVSAAEAQNAINAGQIGDLADFLNLRYLTVGASGAVFGLLLAFGMSFPNLKMFIIPFPFPIKAKWMVI